MGRKSSQDSDRHNALQRHDLRKGVAAHESVNMSIFQTTNRALTAKPEARSSFGEVLPDISGSIVEGNRKRHNTLFYQRVVSFLLERAKRLELSTYSMAKLEVAKAQLPAASPVMT
jgi:hypothetical protein